MTKQQQIDTLQKQLDAIYGGTKYDLSPADLYGQAVISEYLKQQFKEDNNESE